MSINRAPIEETQAMIEWSKDAFYEHLGEAATDIAGIAEMHIEQNEELYNKTQNVLNEYLFEHKMDKVVELSGADREEVYSAVTFKSVLTAQISFFIGLQQGIQLMQSIASDKLISDLIKHKVIR